MTAFIHKVDDYSYDLIAQGLVGEFSMHILSTLFFRDFQYLIEHMEQMKVSKTIPFVYHFPAFKTAPEIDVRLVRRYENEYQIILNLGSRILSQMNSGEFDVALYECKELRGLIAGSKVYFPPVKDIFKK
jgi:hypothetical protein